MNTDDFEKQLQRQPWRTPPAEWREQILREARRQANRPGVHPAAQPRRAGGSRWPRWQEWLWPSPRAWAGLAATWIGIAWLNLVHVPDPRPLARQTPPPPADTATMVAAQRRELVRLLETPTEPAPASKSRLPGPRGEIFSPPKA